MINLYVKFNVHSSYVKQVIVLKSGGQTEGRMDGRTDAPGDDNRHPPKFWLRPKKYHFLKIKGLQCQNFNFKVKRPTHDF